MAAVEAVSYVEVVLAAAMVILMIRIADFENRSPLGWGILAFALVFGSMWVLRYPFVRVILAGALVFGGMTAARMIRED